MSVSRLKITVLESSVGGEEEGAGASSSGTAESSCWGGEGSDLLFGLNENDFMIFAFSCALSTLLEDREGAKRGAIMRGVDVVAERVPARSVSNVQPGRAFRTAFFWSDARPLGRWVVA